ncbi:OsmC family protein [Georgenia faecalis]|uniref:OsmC family protein n=1 Tax=Georgenia faecalis TaxID=2483799 RepID=UPI000FDA0350|nr:OsmC family protein [Georgenia faecalis]
MDATPHPTDEPSTAEPGATAGTPAGTAPADPELADPAPAGTDAAPARALWGERTGVRQYTGRNGRGAEVLIGPGDAEGVFSPGELLQLALAACTALSTDHVLRGRLGDDFPAVVGVSPHPVDGENRYGSFDVELVLDLADLDDEQRAKLAERVERTAGRQCTVARTLDAGTSHELAITHEPMTDES